VISYSARVVPIGKPATVRGDQGQPVTFTFDKHDFSVTRAFLRTGGDIPILLNHNPDLRIGRLRSLDPGRTWWAASFELDDTHGVEFAPGQNVSVGLEWFVENPSCLRRVSELSVVRRGLIPGAEITSCIEIEPKPTEAPRSSAAVPSSSDRAVAGDVIPIQRTARRRPTTVPRDEFERRMDFAIDLAENLGIHGAVEAELEHMQRLERAMQLGRLPPSLLRGVR
jgi:hypothetical protein